VLKPINTLSREAFDCYREGGKYEVSFALATSGTVPVLEPERARGSWNLGVAGREEKALPENINHTKGTSRILAPSQSASRTLGMLLGGDPEKPTPSGGSVAKAP
jgi:hypothetical protein